MERVSDGLWLDAGRLSYPDAHALQERLNRLRQQGLIPDTIMVVEHPPCITIGRAGDEAHILAEPSVLRREGIAVYGSDRGGDVTYHGPGQLVFYPVLHLGDRDRDVHAHARRLEDVMIRTAGSLGVVAGRRRGLPGVWTPEGKIGAIGIAVRRWVTMHGGALNVCPQMRYFDLIVPCGLHAQPVRSLEQVLGRPVSLEVAAAALRHHCERVFRVALRDVHSGGLAGVGGVEPAKTIFEPWPERPQVAAC